MFEQKRFAGRHLLTFESQKLNYFGKKGTGVLTLQCNSYSSDFITFFVCILHIFAYSQIKQDGLEFQILGTI